MLLLKGFLLSSLRYGDYDAILNCFTEEKGYQTFFSKGLYSKRGRYKAYVQPLNELCIAVMPTKTSLQNISKIALLETPSFYTDVRASSICFFIADFLNIILKQENQQLEIYQEILIFLNELEHRKYSAHLVFLMNILRIQGLFPLLSSETYLDPESGAFFPDIAHHFFSKEISSFWKQVALESNPYELKISHKKALLESILVYYHYHYPNFRTPKSLEILQQVFA